MKTTKYLAAVLTVAALAAFRPAEAQIIPDTYINVDWQLNVPVGSSFADKTTGWGMNFEEATSLRLNFRWVPSSPTTPISRTFRARRSSSNPGRR